MTRRPRAEARPISRYEHDWWWGDDGRLYLKLTALQHERATPGGWYKTAVRRMVHVLQRQGVLSGDPGLGLRSIGGAEEWDRSHNLADGFVETITYRTVRAVAPDAAAA